MQVSLQRILELVLLAALPAAEGKVPVGGGRDRPISVGDIVLRYVSHGRSSHGKLVTRSSHIYSGSCSCIKHYMPDRFWLLSGTADPLNSQENYFLPILRWSACLSAPSRPRTLPFPPPPLPSVGTPFPVAPWSVSPLSVSLTHLTPDSGF